MFIIAIIIGIFIGFGAAYMIMGLWVAQSNDHGDSKAVFMDFSDAPLQVFASKDNIKLPK